MFKRIWISLSIFFVPLLFLFSCQGEGKSGTQGVVFSGTPVKVLAVESFLADIAQNVAGDRLHVDTLIPMGLDPHAFEPTPQDVARIADCQVLIINGAGLEGWLTATIGTVEGQRTLIEASKGLTSRQARNGESASSPDATPSPSSPIDPHFWLDPNNAIQYVENIRDGLISVDPAGKDIYTANADAYIAQLKDLDGWIREQVSAIPAQRRLLITNHESFGYFADRYGFQVIGTVIPSVSTGSSPSAQQMAQLVDSIRSTGAPAIFLETGANPQIADQIAQETGVKVVSNLYTESITASGGDAPTYIDMLKFDTLAIVEALR
jgi:ABC-type Zn uptake system ZnuABC Zn-binding protein ZnuA